MTAMGYRESNWSLPASSSTSIRTCPSGGQNNTASYAAASVSGGQHNTANGFTASLSVGSWNTTSRAAASVSGGFQNTQGALSGWSGGAYHTP